MVRFGMTTSVSNAETSVAVVESAELPAERSAAQRSVYRIRHTLPSRFAFLVICIAIVLSALAYGTVHYWALSIFNIGGFMILLLWMLDAAWQRARTTHIAGSAKVSEFNQLRQRAVAAATRNAPR